MNGQSIKYISLFEAAKLTSYSQEYISLLCRQKKLKGAKIGRNWVTTKEWVRDYIDRTKGNGQNVIPVKIKSSLSSSAENAPAGDSIPPVIGKLILTTIICSLFVSGFIFLQLGFQKGAIKINPSQAVKGASAHIAGGIISIDRRFHSPERLWNPVAEISSKIITLSDSLNLIKNESAEFASGKIIALSGRLENAGDGGKELLAEAKNNLSESFGGYSTRIKNNLENLAEPLQTKLARLPHSKDIIFAAIFNEPNINKSERGRVAGVEDSSEGSGTISDEKNDLANEEKKGMVVVPLEGDENSPENIDMINRISSSFSDDVNVKPNEDGASGIINPKNNPEENYLYLMVPVKKE